jgi:hypothetical protein
MLQVLSYGHNSHAKQHRGISREGTVALWSASGYGANNVHLPYPTESPKLDRRVKAELGQVGYKDPHPRHPIEAVDW